MGGKNFIGSFSYNLKDSEVIDECYKMAREDGISFSEFVVSLLKEEVRKKNHVGSRSPINVFYAEPIKPVFTRQLDEWRYKLRRAKTGNEIETVEDEVRRFRKDCVITINIAIDRKMELGIPIKGLPYNL